MIGASACLCGIKCRYDCKSNTDEKIYKLYLKGEVVAICPECLGGLPTPRIPSEIKDDLVINACGDDNTNYFKEGAKKALEILKVNKVEYVVLKEKSPSCGVKYVYDGTFSKTLVHKEGIATKLFKENGIKVISNDEWSR